MGINNNDKLYIFQEKRDIYHLFNYLNNHKNNNNIPRIWSISYDLDEPGKINTIDKNIINNLSNKHYQIFVASLDNGSSNFAINEYIGSIIPEELSSIPYITSVGGTIINENGKEVPATILDPKKMYIISGGGMDGVHMYQYRESPNIEVNYTNEILKNYKYLIEFNNNFDMSGNSQQKAVDIYINELLISDRDNINKELIKKIKDFNSNNNYYPKAYPNIALQSVNYNIVIDNIIYNLQGTSASCPLMASIYSIIDNKIDLSDNHGRLNEFLFEGYYSQDKKKIFKPVVSLKYEYDNNGGTGKTYKKKNIEYINLFNNTSNCRFKCKKEKITDEILVVPYSWNVANNRLSTANKNDEDYGYGFDCVVGLGSIDATELMNYINININS